MVNDATRQFIRALQYCEFSIHGEWEIVWPIRMRDNARNIEIDLYGVTSDDGIVLARDEQKQKISGDLAFREK